MNIDASKVIDRLKRRIADMEVNLALQSIRIEELNEELISQSNSEVEAKKEE